jgi:copper homeostasis protein
MKIGLEICTAGVEDSWRAAELGADRLEVNAALELGGLSPSVGVLREVLTVARIPVVAMARPRPGDFRYSEAEWRALLRDADSAVAAGVQGLAFGTLTDDRRIDVRRTAEFVRLFPGVDTVFHRAFDATSELAASLAILADLGVRRVLTAGGATSAWDGRARLAELHRLAAGRIEILPGGGIRAENARGLLEVVGCRWIHASCTSSTCEADALSSTHNRRLNERSLIELRRCSDEVA